MFIDLTPASTGRSSPNTGVAHAAPPCGAARFRAEDPAEGPRPFDRAGGAGLDVH